MIKIKKITKLSWYNALYRIPQPLCHYKCNRLGNTLITTVVLFGITFGHYEDKL